MASPLSAMGRKFPLPPLREKKTKIFFSKPSFEHLIDIVRNRVGVYTSLKFLTNKGTQIRAR